MEEVRWQGWVFIQEWVWIQSTERSGNAKQRRASASSSGHFLHLLICLPDLKATSGSDEPPHGNTGYCGRTNKHPLHPRGLRMHVRRSKRCWKKTRVTVFIYLKKVWNVWIRISHGIDTFFLGSLSLNNNLSKWKSVSRVQLLVTPWTVACQAPLSMGSSRQEYWSG